MSAQESFVENGYEKATVLKPTRQLTEEQKEKYYRELEKAISRLITMRNIFQWGDFALAHTFVWISVLASFASSIIIAADKKPLDP